MNTRSVRAQLKALYIRMILTGLSVKQHVPTEHLLAAGSISIGDLAISSMTLRNIPYDEIYNELDSNDAYHIKLPDGALVIFQYVFDANGNPVKHRLAFFPSSVLPTLEESPSLYEQDELYADILMRRIVRFPIRFDYDPSSHEEVTHPISHMTLGQFGDCRIPVVSPVMPNTFLKFLLRNFYWRSYRRNMNVFERKMIAGRPSESITDAERRISHFVML